MAAVLLLLLLVVLVVVIPPLSGEVTGCNFPDFLDSHSSSEDATARRDWRTHWRQHVLHHHANDDSSSTLSTSARVIFDGAVMRLEESARRRAGRTSVESASNVVNDTHHGRDQRHGHHHSRQSFTRRCQQTVVSDNGQTRYLATHRQVGESERKFVCIEFVRRSSIVVQVWIVDSRVTNCSTTT